jgi:chromosome segregation ATPase
MNVGLLTYYVVLFININYIKTPIMGTEAKNERELQAEIEALREKFPNTQDLYREVCVLLFFRHGITPTANKLYQLVRKGSMSAPAEALVKFWSDLREKSRVRIENPDLPEDLKIAAGAMVGSLWAKAQEMAQDSCNVIRRESQESVQNAESRMHEAEVARDAAIHDLQQANIAIEDARLHSRELEQKLAGEVATRLALGGQLASSQQSAIEQQKAMDEARRDFSSELEKLREALKVTEERYLAAESRALREIDRERTIAGKIQRELELSRKSATDQADSYRAEIRTLQDEIGNLMQRNGYFEGELRAVNTSKDRLNAELTQERESVRNLSARITTSAGEVETWRKKAIEAQTELDGLRQVKQRKPKKATS